MTIFLSICLFCLFILACKDFINNRNKDVPETGDIFVGAISGEETRVYVHNRTNNGIPGVRFSYANSKYWGYSWLPINDFLEIFKREQPEHTEPA